MFRESPPRSRCASLALVTTTSLLAALLAVACQEARGTAGDISSEDPLVASTQHGPVRGFEEEGILVFKGVRYGADTATTRFAPPAPPEPWTEVRDAFAYGNSAPQGPRGRISLFESWRRSDAGEQRRLPLPERLDSGPARRWISTGDGLVPRRRLH